MVYCSCMKSNPSFSGYFIAFVLSQFISAAFAQESKPVLSVEELSSLALEVRDELETKKDILINLPEELDNYRSWRKSDYSERREAWGESFNTEASSMSPLYPARQLLNRFVEEYESFRDANASNEDVLQQAELRLKPAFRMIEFEIAEIIDLFEQEHGFEVFYAEYLEVDLSGFIQVSAKLSFYRAEALEHALYLGMALEEMGDVFHPRNKNNLNPSFYRFSIARSLYPSLSDAEAALALGRVFSRAASIQERDSKENALAHVELAVGEVAEHNEIKNMEVAFELVDLALSSPSKAYTRYVSSESAGALISLLSSDERTLEIIRKRLSIAIESAKLNFKLAVSDEDYELDTERQWRGSRAKEILEFID